MLKITKVARGSVCDSLGIEKGDRIVAFDSCPAEDELDLLYYATANSFTMTVEDKRGKGKTTFKIEKDEDEELGIEIEKCGKIRTCQNHCIFCFVDQMPKGLRESLYVKDDDYGMSFACGNFVTLTNLSEEGLNRICRLHLSPLYISVHTMNGALREKLLRNRFAGKIGAQIETLAKHEIKMHCQAVIVPNMNDGDELKDTARKLFSYYPTVQDLAVVPTGLTKYRIGLTEIPDVDGAYSKAFLKMVDELNKEFGVNFVLPADEYFIKAGVPFKDESFYGDFEQIENGIGMTSKFISETKTALADFVARGEKPPFEKKKTVVISGVSAEKVNRELANDAEKAIDGLEVDVLAIENDFFGHTVTCTGLLTGVDILRALKKYREEKGAFDEVILPSNTLKEFEDVFLCGMRLSTLKKELKFKNIRVNREGGFGFVRILATKK